MRPVLCPRCRGPVTLTSLTSRFMVGDQPWGLSWAFGAPKLEEVPQAGPALSLQFNCPKCATVTLAFDGKPTQCGWT